MSSDYQVLISDPLGNPFPVPKNWVSLDYVLAETDVCPLTLVLPGNYDRGFLNWLGLVEIWRSVDGGAPYLEGERVWFIQDWYKTIAGKQRAWEIQCKCANFILDTALVDYNAGNAYTYKLDEADDLGKAIVRENRGSLATDSTRNLSTYLAVAPDQAAAPILRKAFERRFVLDVLRDLAAASLQAGTYLAFDVVATTPPTALEFRSYTGQRGQDHRNPSGANGPVLIGTDFGNLTDAKVGRKHGQAITRAIATGQGLGEVVPSYRTNDAALQGLSPFALVEGYQNASNTADATGLQDAADGLLKARRPRLTVEGRLAETTGLRYGVHWRWGDYLTAQIDGETIDVHADRVHVTVQREGGEKVDAILRSES